jgi:hypothetical protein
VEPERKPGAPNLNPPSNISMQNIRGKFRGIPGNQEDAGCKAHIGMPLPWFIAGINDFLPTMFQILRFFKELTYFANYALL